MPGLRLILCPIGRHLTLHLVRRRLVDAFSVLAVLLLVAAPLPAQTGPIPVDVPPDSGPDLRDALFLAIELNDVNAVRQALIDGAHHEVNFGDPSPLGTAVELNNLAIVRLILRVGGDPAGILDNPLPMAVGNDEPEMVRLLLEAGAPFPGRDATARQIFESAVRGNHAQEILGHLLAEGADAAEALPVAVERGSLDVVRMLLRAGAPASILSPHEENILQLLPAADPAAGPLPKPEDVQALIDDARAGGDDAEADLSYFLQAAVVAGEMELVQMVLDEGATAGYEHLKIAAEEGRELIALTLLPLVREDHDELIDRAITDNSAVLEEFLDRAQAGRRLRLLLPAAGALGGVVVLVLLFLVARNWIFRSPQRLHDAVTAGNLKGVERLLKGGADPNVVFEDHTPLHVAIQEENLKMARLLLNHGARANQKADDELGMTALHIAASIGHVGLADMLLRHGSQVDVRDATGQTPLYVAAGAANDEMMGFLVERGADPNARLEGGVCLMTAAIRAEDTATARLLLTVGADPDADSSEKPIVAAAKIGDIELIEALLAHGADPNVVDLSGATALEIALRQGNEELANLMRREGVRAPMNLLSAPVAPAAGAAPIAAPPGAVPDAGLQDGPRAVGPRVSILDADDPSRATMVARPASKPPAPASHQTMVARPSSMPQPPQPSGAHQTMVARPASQAQRPPQPPTQQPPTQQPPTQRPPTAPTPLAAPDLPLAARGLPSVGASAAPPTAPTPPQPVEEDDMLIFPEAPEDDDLWLPKSRGEREP